MAIPAMGASPTYSGTLSCTNLNGEQVELEAVSGASRKVIAERRSFWRGTGFCASGSFDTSGLSRDA